MPNDDDGQDQMFRFIPLKEVDRFATFGEVATPKVLHDMTMHQAVDRPNRTTSHGDISAQGSPTAQIEHARLLAHFCGTLCRLLCGIPMLISLDLGTPLPLTWDSL